MRCATASRRSPSGSTRCKAAGCERILIAPLYPQYCAATTATANDEAFAHLRRLRWQPAVRTLPPYHDDPAYIGALEGAAGGRRSPRSISSPQAILASFHGMPQRTLRARRSLSLPLPQDRAAARARRSGASCTVAFQSRFGRAKWLEPATDTTLAALPGRGRDEGRDPRARLLRRLPGDAGGAGDPRPRHLPRRRRHAISPICPASTTARAGHGNAAQH